MKNKSNDVSIIPTYRLFLFWITSESSTDGQKMMRNNGVSQYKHNLPVRHLLKMFSKLRKHSPVLVQFCGKRIPYEHRKKNYEDFSKSPAKRSARLKRILIRFMENIPNETHQNWKQCKRFSHQNRDFRHCTVVVPRFVLWAQGLLK